MNSLKLINLTPNSIFLDTNIFVYAVGKNHQLKTACQEILVSLEASDFQAVVSVEVWQELLHYFQKRNNFIETIDLFFSLPITVLPVNENILRQSFKLLKRYSKLQARDAIHVATMLEYNISQIFSADTDFDNIQAIQRIDPNSFRL